MAVAAAHVAIFDADRGEVIEAVAPGPRHPAGLAHRWFAPGGPVETHEQALRSAAAVARANKVGVPTTFWALSASVRRSSTAQSWRRGPSG